MLRKIFDTQLQLTEKGKPLARFRPLVASLDAFFYEPKEETQRAPHIRDAVDLKRWMILVVVALLPCIIMAIWNTGLQGYVYSSGDAKLMDQYLNSLSSFQSYFDFAFSEGRWIEILKTGAWAFLPVVLVSYMVGGLVEMIFALFRGHELAEGFLVTGILYPLVLPPTIPLWMVAVGVAVGIIFAKEVFGGTGMNIMNPALACRAFLFFGFPGRMTGDVWVGTSATEVRNSLVKMNQEAQKGVLDGYSQATGLAHLNVSHDIKRIHVDAIASNGAVTDVGTNQLLHTQFESWNKLGEHKAVLGHLEPDQLKAFVTAPLSDGGLGLASSSYDEAFHLADLSYGISPLNSDGSFFFGNKLGCMGETSVLACLLGALFLIWTGVGSWRTMVAVGLGAFLTASIFEWCAKLFGQDGGAWNPAVYAFSAYKHLLLGGLMFGLVFMATDPVSSPTINSAKWIYGLFIGAVAIVIRLVNPAYPEGVMLAIIMGNVFAPLFDYYAGRFYRKRRGRVAIA